MKTIRIFIMTASVLISALFFGSAYFIVSHAFEHALQENSIRSSRTIAKSTFDAMFQLMSTGWTHAQAENFLHATNGSMRDSDFALQIYRGSIVSARYGPIRQAPMDAAVTQVFRTGQPVQDLGADSTRYVLPLRAETECLRCHTNARIGNVLGVIDVRQNLAPSIQAARHDFLDSMLWIFPFPILGAFLLTVFVNWRIDRSMRALEHSIAQVNEMTDLKSLVFQPIDLWFSELNGIFRQVGQLIAKLRGIAIEKDYIADHDALTGLLNRRGLLERLARALARARRHGGRVVIGILDLDDFKPVNDTWGHAAGDALLRELGGRLQAVLRETDVAARLGGDEFVIILEQISATDDLSAVLARLESAITAPYVLPGGHEARIGLSLGLTQYPEDDAEPEILLRHADEALYAIKERKATRQQGWMWWNAMPVPNDQLEEDGLATPAYGAEAAALLGCVRGSLLSAAAEFITIFYATLARQGDAQTILQRLDADEFAHLRERQLRHLEQLLAPELTAAAHRSSAHRLGRIHTLVGLDQRALIEAMHLHLQTLRQVIGKQGLRAVERSKLMNLLSRRLLTELEEQIKGGVDLTQAREHMLLSLHAPQTPASNWSDFMRAMVDKLVELEGFRGVAVARPDAEGHFVFEYTAGAFDAYLHAIDQQRMLPEVADPATHFEQISYFRAWRSERIETTDSYASHPGMARLRDAARAAGIRSSAAVPLKDAQGHLFSVLILFGSYPGMFETPPARTFLESLGLLVSQRQHEFMQEREFAPVSAERRHVLRGRLYGGSMELHYQPVVDFRTGKPYLVEALARLRLHDGALAAPAEFLPGFGQAELVRLFREGLHQVADRIQAWDAMGLELDVGLNLPPAVLVDPDCPGWVHQALQERGIAASRLRLELLETEELQDIAKVGQAVAALAGLGVRLAMDDLGAGYSSLLRLRTLPFSTVKIDQGLMRAAPQDPLRAIGFIGSLVRLAQSLDLRVVVEGLESAALVEAAAVLGANAGQGYALARPMPAAEVPGWMRSFTLQLDPRHPRTALGALAGHWSWEHGVRHAGARAQHDEGTCALGRFIASQGLAGSNLDIAHRHMHRAAVEHGTDSAAYRQWAQQVTTELMQLSDGTMGLAANRGRGRQG